MKPSRYNFPTRDFDPVGQGGRMATRVYKTLEVGDFIGLRVTFPGTYHINSVLCNGEVTHIEGDEAWIRVAANYDYYGKLWTGTCSTVKRRDEVLIFLNNIRPAMILKAYKEGRIKF